jgi:hypothetical protein
MGPNLNAGPARCEQRNPRWEPGMGMIPDPRQIGEGGGDGPPSPGKSGMAVGMDPRSPANRGSGIGDDPRLPVRVCAEQLHLMGSRMSPRLASVAVITRGRRVRIVASVYCQRSALQVRSRHRRRRRLRRRQCHCLRRSWHDRTWRGRRRSRHRRRSKSIPAMKVRIRNLHA